MSKSLDFTKIKKQYFTVTLPDENSTTLMISSPTKAVMDAFISMKDTLSAESMGDDAISELYEICAKIMSRNKMGIRVTVAKLEEIFDFEDIILFIRDYSAFINGISEAYAKN